MTQTPNNRTRTLFDMEHNQIVIVRLSFYAARISITMLATFYQSLSILYKGNNAMGGISYLVNEQGQRSAVVIDLAIHGEIWEDFYDTLTAQERRDEPLESLDDVLKKLQRSDNMDIGQ
jgi:hypothetical protein